MKSIKGATHQQQFKYSSPFPPSNKSQSLAIL
ncbi:hypothetical protein F383_32543 [Gossypium arboreum]|uniref:Uncharacterized protein n=1 Tax=Gossypium arboreum TaxID=29729 RepID=A0A0B0N1H5_GOSAR|nr:hypothetical protein F383_32543 [Gossypium arboreum]